MTRYIMVAELRSCVGGQTTTAPGKPLEASRFLPLLQDAASEPGVCYPLDERR